MYDSRQRWILITCTVSLGVTVLDDTVVYLALPDIAADLGVDLAGQQWVVNAYLLVLSSLLLLGGALGDRYGRRRMLMVGLTLFTLASVGAAVAPDHPLLVVARLVEGGGAALIMPNTLAILRSSFDGEQRGQAIGQWSAFSGVAAAVGPPLAGLLILMSGWRAVFLLSVPVSVAAIWMAWRHVPESCSDEARGRPIDVVGALLTVVVAGGLATALIEGHARGFSSAEVLVAAALAVIALPTLLWRERVADQPLVPPGLLKIPAVAAANVATFTLYGAYHGSIFLVVIYLQVALGYTALQTGLAILPVTAVLMIVAPAAGRLAGRIGPRWPAAVGQATVALAMAWLAFLEPGDAYATAILPGILLFGFGFGSCIPALTDTAVSAVEERIASVASAVNSVADRLGALFAIAMVGLVFSTAFIWSFPTNGGEVAPEVQQAAEAAQAGPQQAIRELSSDSPHADALWESYVFAYRTAILTAAGFALIGSVVSAVGMGRRDDDEAPEAQAADWGDAAPQP